MKGKKGAILLLCLAFLLMLPVGLGSADWELLNTDHYDLEIDAGDHYSFYTTPDRSGLLWVLDFTVTSGNDIDFFLMDDENFEEWLAGRSSYAKVILEKIGSDHVEFEITPERVGITWRAVFSNEYSFITKKDVSVDTAWYEWVGPPPTSLSVSATTSPTIVMQGEPFTLTAQVTNIGESTATDVAVSIELPDGMTTSTTQKNLGTVETSASASFTITAAWWGTYSINVTVIASNVLKATTDSVTVEVEPGGQVTRTDGNIQYDREWTTAKYGSVLHVRLLTNERWETGKWYTLKLWVEAAAFGEDVDRFHEISGEIRITHHEKEIYSNVVSFYDVGSVGDPREQWLYVGFSDTELGLQMGKETSITVRYCIHFKEGVILGIDTELSTPWAPAFTITIESKKPHMVAGKSETHTLHLDHKIEKQYSLPLSVKIPGTDVTFELTFEFNTIWEITDDTTIVTTTLPAEVSTTDPFELMIGLDRDSGNRNFWNQVNLGIRITSGGETWEVMIPMPTQRDVDGDGSPIALGGTTFYAWDRYISVGGHIEGRYGNLLETEKIEVECLGIDILDYIRYVLPAVEIANWILDLSLVLTLRMQSVSLEYIWYEVAGTELISESSTSNALGYYDLDSTDELPIGTTTEMTAKVSGNAPTAEISLIPCISGMIYYKLGGTIQVNLGIEGLGSIPLFDLMDVGYIQKMETFQETFPAKAIGRTIVYTAFIPETTSIVPEFCLHVGVCVLVVGVMAFLRKVKRLKV